MKIPNRTALLVVVLLVVGVFVSTCLLLPKNTIVLKNDGFHPRTLTITQGETVTFKSERGKYFWPASDFHPSHKLFPAFDPKEPIAPNDSWSFTFDKAGTYPFHDHLAAFYFGIIRVEDAEGNVRDDCAENGDTFQCWQNKIFYALAEHGVSSAYDAVSELYESEPDFAQSCHGIAHNIGLASYQFYSADPTFIFSPKAIACGAGFYHGFMEGYLGATEDVAGAAKVCDEIGEIIGHDAPDARYQCYHGIGHGAVETTIASSGSFGGEDAFIASAIQLCEQASEGGEERYRCVSGVFNGIANFYINGEYGLSFEKESPLALCSRQEKAAYKDSCYGNMNSVLLWWTKGDLEAAAKYIFSIPEKDHQESALRYLMWLYALNHVHDDSFASVVDECHRFPSSFIGTCVTGFIGGLVEHGSPGIEYKQAVAFCREDALSNSERDVCRKEILGKLDARYSIETAQAICSSVTLEEQAYCKK